MKTHYSYLQISSICIVFLISLTGCPDPLDPCIDCSDPACDCYTPPPVWEKTYVGFNMDLWPNTVVINDSLNIWISAIAIPEVNPVPNMPVYIFNTTNGGITWNSNLIPSTNSLMAAQLTAIDGNTAWINVRTKGLYKTTNGGSSWTLINETSDFKDNSLSLHFFNAAEGVARFFHNEDGIQNDSIVILRTTDGGVSWTGIPYSKIGNKIQGESGYYHGNGHFKAIGDTVAFPTSCGRIFMSFNKGIDWQIVAYNTGSYECFSSMAMISSRKFALNSMGQTTLTTEGSTLVSYGTSRIFATRDRGLTWFTPVSLPTYSANLSPVPGMPHAYIATFYRILNRVGGTLISNDDGKTFIEADSLCTNIGITGFYSVHHAFGVSFNANESGMTDKTNYIYKWNPEYLFRKGKLK